MWEGQALPHDTKFGNSRCEIVGRRVIFIWSLIHGLRWSGLIKAEPGGRNRRTVNSSTSPHISGQLGTETGCENIVMLIHRHDMSSGARPTNDISIEFEIRP